MKMSTSESKQNCQRLCHLLSLLQTVLNPHLLQTYQLHCKLSQVIFITTSIILHHGPNRPKPSPRPPS